MRQLRETRQHWRDRKRLLRSELAQVREEHRRLLEMLENEHPIEGEQRLAAAWQHYSYVQFAENWVLVYRVEQTHTVLVRVGELSEIFD